MPFNSFKYLKFLLPLLALSSALAQVPLPGSGGGGASNIGDLGGVDLTSETDGDGLRVNASGDFVNVALFTVGTTDLLAARMSGNVLAAVGGGLSNSQVPYVSGGVLSGSDSLRFSGSYLYGTSLTGTPRIITNVAGSSAAPTFTYSGDTGTGLTRTGAGAQAITSAGVNFATFGGSQTALFQDTTAGSGDTLVVVKGGDTEAANVFEVQNSTGTVNAAITAGGVLAAVSAVVGPLGASRITGSAGFYQDIPEITPSGNPAADTLRLYVSAADGNLYYRDSAGTDTEIGAAGSIGADTVGTSELDDGSDTPVAGLAVVVAAGATEFEYLDAILETELDTIAELQTQIADATVLTTADEGSGNGIDADTLDGSEGAAYLLSAALNTISELQSQIADATLLTTADEGTGNGIDADTVDGVEAAAFATPSGSQTFTNKTYDAEATGNALTIPSFISVPVAVCTDDTTGAATVSLPTTNAPAAGCVSTTTNDNLNATLAFDQTTDESFQFSFRLPPGWTGDLGLDVWWQTTATTGNVVWSTQTACIAAGEDEDVAFNTADAFTADTADGQASDWNVASDSALTVTGCAADELLHLKFFRDADNGSDTLAADALVKEIRLVVRNTF